jgi:hypothetical protein
MNATIDFRQSLAARSDEQLYNMLAHAGDYVPEAISLAQDELTRRCLSPERQQQLQEISDAAREQEKQKENAPLGLGMRILIMIMGLIFGTVLSLYYDYKGFQRKAQETWSWIFWGYAAKVGFILYVWLVLG